ncbi:MAG: guanine deaminase [Pelosinus sp.]|nr:guanine deaminase [Pelosinus sp.]
MARELLILKGDIIFTPMLGEFAIHENSYLVVQCGKVRGIYQMLPQEYQGLGVEDCTGDLIIPGFVDLHTHAAQFMQRGFGLDMELLDWLNHYTFPEEGKFQSTDYAAKVYALFAEELIKQGTTRAAVFGTIHQQSNCLLFQILVRKGIGAYVGKVNMDANCPEFLKENTSESLAATEKLLCEWAGNTLVKPIITPRFAPTSTGTLLAGLGEIAVKYNLPVQSHLAENLSEIAWVRELFPGQREYHNVYDYYNLFGQTPTLMAHCIHLSADAISCMARQQVVAVHCPDSNLNLTSGIMPARKLLQAGVRVGLGSDIGAGHSLSIPEAIVKAIQLSKVNFLRDNSQKPLTLAEGFYLATKGGGSFFGKVGSFEEGYAFDALVIKDRADLGLSLEERLQRFIYTGEPSQIHGRYIAGKKI